MVKHRATSGRFPRHSERPQLSARAQLVVRLPSQVVAIDLECERKRYQVTANQGRWLIFGYSLLMLAALITLAALYGRGDMTSLLPRLHVPTVALYSSWSGALGAVAISLKGVYDHRVHATLLLGTDEPLPQPQVLNPPVDAKPAPGDSSPTPAQDDKATKSKDPYDDTSSPWDNDWLPWYFGRPFTGIIVGIAVFILLKAVYPSGTPSAATISAASFVLGTQESRFFEWVKQIGAVVVSIPHPNKSSKTSNSSS